MLTDIEITIKSKPSDGNMSKISEFLKNYRYENNLTQEKMSKLLKMDRGNYAKIECDTFSLPLKTLKTLFKSLNEDEKLELQQAIKEDMTANFIKQLSELLDDLNS